MIKSEMREFALQARRWPGYELQISTCRECGEPTFSSAKVRLPETCGRLKCMVARGEMLPVEQG